jgi:hypothetical protein
MHALVQLIQHKKKILENGECVVEKGRQGKAAVSGDRLTNVTEAIV